MGGKWKRGQPRTVRSVVQLGERRPARRRRRPVPRGIDPSTYEGDEALVHFRHGKRQVWIPESRVALLPTGTLIHWSDGGWSVVGAKVSKIDEG